MIKRALAAAALAAALQLGMALPAAGVERVVPVQVDGAVLAAESYLESGVTYVPLRALLDAFGGWELHWDAESRRAVASSEGMALTADPAADLVTVNGRSGAGRVTVRQGRTYVPLRLTAALCGGEAEWDGVLGGAAVTSPGAAYDAGELYWLSRIISAESQGEPLAGQVAVGNVVLNRVASEAYPNTVREVIFDTRDGVQFEPVSNGTVYLDPTASAVEAAKLALSGAVEVGGCMYFYAPALSPGTWINENRTYYTTIGCHRFYL